MRANVLHEFPVGGNFYAARFPARAIVVLSKPDFHKKLGDLCCDRVMLIVVVTEGR